MADLGRRIRELSGKPWEMLDTLIALDSHTCIKPKCDFKKEYGVVNKTQFFKRSCAMCVVILGSMCHALHGDTVAKRESILDNHCGEHTCPFKPALQQPQDEIRRNVCENPSYTPSKIQSNIILSKMWQRSDWNSIEKAAIQALDRKWISNEKQKMKMKNEPHGHNFEAVPHFKQYVEVCNPYYVYKLNDRRSNPDKPSFVFKTSRFEVKFVLNMDRSNDHILSQEFSFFDGKIKICKGFVSLGASIYQAHTPRHHGV